MKIKIYAIALLLLSMTSCNKLLDVDPYTFSRGEDYYKTEDQIRLAVNGVYATTQATYTGNFPAMTEMRSDNTNYQYDESNRGAQQREEIDEFLISPTNNQVQDVWSRLYATIQQANIVLGKIDAVTFTDETLKNQYKGELQFLRAMQYFHLVRLFGEVPLILEEISGPATAFGGEKASVQAVYDQIILDAKAAAGNLPPKFTGANLGRATKAAAMTLLGEVYITLKQYNLAIPALQEVTTMGYGIMDNYADNFDPTKKNNKESIYAIQFNYGLESEAANWIFSFGPRDGRQILTGFGGTLGGWNTPTPSMVNAYEPGDVRKDASIQMFTNAANTKYQEAVYFGGSTIPFIRKYYHPPYPRNSRSDENMPVYRYSYVLLMLSEAMAESGTGDPYGPLNEVRQRANLGPLSGLTTPDLKAAILHEQRVELAFENHRWFQLLRSGKAIEIMTAHGNEQKALLPRLSDATYNIQPYKLLYPIPERETRLNNIEQNPEWK